MRVMTKRGLVLSLVLGLCALSRSAWAEDACSSLFLAPSPHLSSSEQRCDLSSARAHFHSQISPLCAQAARAGEAAESMERLFAIAATKGRAVPCDDERRQLAMYGLCALRAPNQSK